MKHAIPECYSEQRDMQANTCKDNKKNLDACRNENVNQYYRMRSTG